MSDYESDILTWSEEQAALLRQRAAGELANDAALDWINLAEEIEAVGRSELHAVEGLLRQALRHILKAEAWPLSLYAATWKADAIDFRQQAGERFVESMRQRLNLTRLYRQAIRGLPETVDGQSPLPVPEHCPVTLDELLADDLE